MILIDKKRHSHFTLNSWFGKALIRLSFTHQKQVTTGLDFEMEQRRPKCIWSLYLRRTHQRNFAQNTNCLMICEAKENVRPSHLFSPLVSHLSRWETINHHPLSSWYLSIILSLMVPFWWFCQVTPAPPARPADMVEMALVVVVVGTWVFGHGRKMEGKCEKILGKYGKTYYKWRFIAGENLL